MFSRIVVKTLYGSRHLGTLACGDRPDSDGALPLAHVTAVDHDPELVGRWWHGLKVLGTDVPGLFAAGTFYYCGELVFWEVLHPERAVIVSLQHERYKKLIMEADPTETVSRLRQAIRTNMA
jgi:hypothetical protein